MKVSVALHCCWRHYISLIIVLGVGFLFAVASSVLAKTKGQPRPTQVVRMSPPREGDGLPQIVNGEKQDVTRWPATLRYYRADMLSCTSTIIGGGPSRW
jgi:hypothetical protein